MTKRIAILCALAAAGCAATSDDPTATAESAATAPVSTVSVTIDDGNPTSQFPTTPSMTTTCTIPKVVLDQYPIFQGDPKMTSCTLVTRVTNPPPGVSITLECQNTKNGATYDSFTCAVTVGLGVFSTIGIVRYGDPAQGTVAIPNASCSAYLQRAAGICGATGVSVN